MRRVVVLTCILVVAAAASASAAHFDVIPAGTISVTNTSGQQLGSIVNDNLGWADAITGSKMFDMDQVKLAKVEGEVTDMTGGRGLGTGGNWTGTWGTIGITDYDWLNGEHVNDPAFASKANSYKIGWIQNMSIVTYAAGAGAYADVGTRLGFEDTRSVSGHWKDQGYTYVDAAFQFKAYWDLSAYDPANPAAGGGLAHLDTLDPANAGAGWWSEQNGDTHPAGGLPIGIMHGDYDPSQAGYYDSYDKSILTIALVEDELGLGGTITYTDITLDVVGKVLGDVNLDGVVTQADLDIANGNMGSTDAHWGMGDVTGGGANDWGGLDGVVDAQDIAAITAALGGGIEGDLNADGAVNSGDLDLVRGNWGRTDATSTFDGDATGDGFVNSLDLDVVRGNWGNTAAAAVPEPGFLMLAAAGLLALALRRK